MDLKDFFENNREEILTGAVESLNRSHLPSYENSKSENREKLERLSHLVEICVNSRNLEPIKEYSRKIAGERFEAGFDLQEVHTAFNVLEEAIWKKIIKTIPPAELGEALGLISTTLGAGKEELALTYVMLASKVKTKTLDLNALFK